MKRDLDYDYPSMADLRRKARRRIPRFAFEYLDSATGSELGAKRNRKSLDSVLFTPEILHGKLDCLLERQFMGKTYSLPIGVAPVGMSGSIWPGAEKMLARCSAKSNIPYCLSTVGCALPEEIGPIAGGQAWFQLYVPEDAEIRRDMIRRAHESGFDKLVVTVDVPADSRRERQRRSQMTYPPTLGLQLLSAVASRPRWLLQALREGIPRMRFVESYVDPSQRAAEKFKHPGRVMRGSPDWSTIAEIREEWDRHLLIKGVARPEDARRLVGMGADGIWVSNHSGRQFEAGPATIDVISSVRAAVGDDVPVVFDSGVAGGLDVMRAIARGADMVFLGRAFHYAVGALGEAGINHLLHIVDADMRANMAQIGAATLEQLKCRLVTSD
ncbi:MAG: alpha-hydroxy acid oxidase [Rhodobacteraceae bacterium]|nr:alpha-hydroxy acid oxidase [Paracoccaceae bacterium]